MTDAAKTILLATGGTGGHIFPAEALADVLASRGHMLVLVTDKRFEGYQKQSDSAFYDMPIHYISASAMSGTPWKKGIGMFKNSAAYMAVRRILRQVKPDAVVGFGGYPSFPTMLAAGGRVPCIIHEQNALLGKANRMVAAKADVIATSFNTVAMIKDADADKVRLVGNPVRGAVKALRDVPYGHLQPDGKMQLLITGGSQGAAILGDVVPKAIRLLPDSCRRRLRIDQQVRAEQLDELRNAYDAMNVQADIAPFFTDIPTRLASAHLMIARSGASTVAELACAGRPAILVPLPHSADDHQKKNAQALEDAGGAWLMPQDAFTPEALAARLESLLNLPATLQNAAAAARAMGKPDAASALADLVEAVARREQV